MQSRFRLVSLLAALATVLTFAGAVAGAAVLKEYFKRLDSSLEYFLDD